MAEVMTHAPDCYGVDLYETTGRRGDPMTRCRGCGRFTLAKPVESATAAAVAPVAPRPAPRPAPRMVDESPRVLTIPPSGYVARHGDRWPTHVAKARHKRANRCKATREADQ